MLFRSNLVHAIDSHYHHLTDDVIAGGMLRYIDGAMSPPEGPGLGISLDQDKLALYAEAFARQQAQKGQEYTADPRQPDWYAKYPGW